MHSRFAGLIVFVIVCLCLIQCQLKPKWEQYEGGIHVVLKAESKGDPTVDATNIARIAETIGTRLKVLGLKKKIIRIRDNREIVIQLPPCKNPDFVVRVISTPAILEFKLVDEENSLEEALKGNIPPNGEILYQVKRMPGSETKIPFLLKKNAILTGEYLTDAKVTIDKKYNEPYISISFDSQGAQLLEQITGANIQKRLAIILDDIIYSAPVIHDRISSGYAQITGAFTMDEARDLANVLRSGGFPVRAKLIEYKALDEKTWLGGV